jgi:hypothetical protein
MMNKKMKSCFTPHVAMHSLFGVGLGIVLVSLFPILAVIWIGVLLMIIAVSLDAVRKG